MTTSTLIETTAATFARGSLVESTYSGMVVLVTEKGAIGVFAGTVVHAGTEPALLLGQHSESWIKSCFEPATKGVQLTP